MTDNLGLEEIRIETDEEIPYSIIENYILDIEGLSANKKLFLITLRKYAGAAKKEARPSYNTLMKKIGSTSPATIMKCIDFFIWLRWLERINRYDPKKNNEKLSNFYILSLKNIKMVLDYFEQKEYKFSEIEKYFEGEYKDKEKKKQLLSNPCKYLL
jgi:hypothetical protein